MHAVLILRLCFSKKCLRVEGSILNPVKKQTSIALSTVSLNDERCWFSRFYLTRVRLSIIKELMFCLRAQKCSTSTLQYNLTFQPNLSWTIFPRKDGRQA
jgi:hypothetical protein